MNGLTVDNVTKSYDGFRALDRVSLHADQGSCVAVVGPNGAGKSTLFAIIAGQLKPTEGRVAIDGRDITGVTPHKLAAQGVGRTFQVARLFGSFTVRESMVLARQLASRRRLRARDPMRDHTLREDCAAALELVRLTPIADRMVSALTQGERKRLEFGMALVQDPRVLVLDEPTAGMNRSDVELVMDVLREAKQAGTERTILLSSHDMDVVFGLADRMAVMARGTVLLEGEPRTVADDQRVADVYLGRR
jgi:branched-chain amino acid transport system ATP-binding protein